MVDLFDFFPTAALIFVAALLVASVLAIWSEYDAYQKFMAQCRQDHKEYECTAMWRDGSSRSVLVPMPIVIPAR